MGRVLSVDMRLLIAPIDLMAQAHVIPSWSGQPVDPAAIRYIVTDRNDTDPRSPLGRARIWDGDATASGKSTTRLDRACRRHQSQWHRTRWDLAGRPKTAFLVVADGRSAPALFANVQPARARAGSATVHVTIGTSAGARAIEIHQAKSGSHRPDRRQKLISITITIRRGKITYRW